MKKVFVCFLILFLSACGEKAEEKTFLDKNVKSFLEYNEIAGVTPKIQLSDILTKMTEVKMHIQDYKFSKDCQHTVEYLVENMDVILNIYKNFSLKQTNTQDNINKDEKEKVLKETLEYNSCHKLIPVIDKRKQNKLLLEEISKKEPNIKLITQYIHNGADVNLKYGGGFTVLMYASASESPHALDIVKLLIDNGANINDKAADGSSALMHASISDSLQALDVVKLLIDNGASINDKDANGHSALMHASISDSLQALDVVKLLIDNGASINDKDASGRSALSNAIISGYIRERPQVLEIIKLLIENGADVNTKDANGHSALRYASLNKNPQASEIVKFLKEHGAK